MKNLSAARKLHPMKFKIIFSSLFILLYLTTILKAQNEISQYAIEAYEEEGWVYVGGNTFLYGEKEKGYGNPNVLSLNIDPLRSSAMLYLYEYDCSNKRIMMIAYKSYQNKPLMEKENYLFENKREWQYPLKTTLGDIMMRAVCRKFE